VNIGKGVVLGIAGLVLAGGTLWWTRQVTPAPRSMGFERKPVDAGKPRQAPARLPASIRISDSTVLDGANTETVSEGGRAFGIVTRPPEYSGPAKDYVQALLPASSAGDATATWRIWLRIHTCQPAVEEVNPGELAAYARLGLAEQFLQSILDQQAACGSLIADPGLWERQWLALAAEQGSLEARLMYATSPEYALGRDFDALAHPDEVIAYRDRAMAYLRQAAGDGNVDALISLSTAYRNGVMVSADPVTSHAYARVVLRVDPGLDMGVEEMAKELSPMELREARVLAERLYRECCL